MNANSDAWSDRDERRRLRREQRWAMRGQCDSFAHVIRGPITLITLGALFAMNNFTPYGFDKTWPVLLIVFGLLTLLGRSMASPAPPVGAAPGSAPPYNYPPPPPPAGYKQSQYSQPPAPAAPGAGASATVKGGFGTSAPPRATGSDQTPPEGGSV